MKYPLILTLYGILLVALLPLLIGLLANLGTQLEDYITRLGSSVIILAILGLVVFTALYVWLKIARWFIERGCRE